MAEVDTNVSPQANFHCRFAAKDVDTPIGSRSTAIKKI
jgi:hypothetical protein